MMFSPLRVSVSALLLTALTSLSGVTYAATNLDEFRKEFAQAVYAASPEMVHDRNPQPLLRAVVVLNIKLGEGRRWLTDVMRTNRDQPEMLTRAIEAVDRVRLDAAIEQLPASVREELMRNGINETWLFDKDGSFQVMTLAKPQSNKL